MGKKRSKFSAKTDFEIMSRILKQEMWGHVVTVLCFCVSVFCVGRCGHSSVFLYFCAWTCGHSSVFLYFCISVCSECSWLDMWSQQCVSVAGNGDDERKTAVNSLDMSAMPQSLRKTENVILIEKILVIIITGRQNAFTKTSGWGVM